MIQRSVLLYLFSILFLSCSRTLSFSTEPLSRISGVEIIAKNLTEDGNIFSSGDDEIAVFLLEGNFMPFKKSYTLNDECARIVMTVDGKSFVTSNMTLIIVEIDEERPFGDLRKIVSKHHKEMIDDYRKFEYLAIERYLGDDDVLYAGKLDPLNPSIDIQSSHRGDRYHYIISLLPPDCLLYTSDAADD